MSSESDIYSSPSGSEKNSSSEESDHDQSDWFGSSSESDDGDQNENENQNQDQGSSAIQTKLIQPQIRGHSYLPGNEKTPMEIDKFVEEIVGKALKLHYSDQFKVYFFHFFLSFSFGYLFDFFLTFFYFSLPFF